MPLSITAVVCTYERYESLPLALDSLLAQDLSAAQVRLLVADNSPAAAAGRAALDAYRHHPSLTIIDVPEAGLSHARNAALAACETEVIAFLDDDASASTSWLRRILAAFEAFGPTVAAVGGPVRPRWGAPRPPWLGEEAMTFLSIIDWGGERRVAGLREWLAGTNIAFSTSRLRSVGGFATYLGRNGRSGGLVSGEEFDACRRLRRAGGLVIYDPAVVVEHAVPAERLRQSWLRRRASWQAVSDYFLDSEHATAALDRSWPAVGRFLATLPADRRSLLALSRDVDDAESLRWQLRAITAVTLLFLTGQDAGELPPEDPPFLLAVRNLLPATLRPPRQRKPRG